MSYSLLNSSLIPFRAPPDPRVPNPCTASTIEQILQVSALSSEISFISISCTPNIWTESSVKINSADDIQTTEVPHVVGGKLHYSDDSLRSSVSNSSIFSHESKYNLTSPESDQDTASAIDSCSTSFYNFPIKHNARFFVIKSYSALDVDASIANGIWASTDLGNKRLDRAYRESGGEVYLLFSVNGSSMFCGVAKMMAPIDFTRTSDIWAEASRWKGIFPVQWLAVEDIPNKYFRHLKVPSNENKSVVKSRDTQELPFEVGISMLRFFSSWQPH